MGKISDIRAYADLHPITGLGPSAFFGRTANRTGPRKLQNPRTADRNRKKPQKKRKKPVVTGPGMNTVKHVLDRQNSDMGCNNKL
jgi:hypothetical protein